MINACRIYLKVNTLADITNYDGRIIIKKSMDGRKRYEKIKVKVTTTRTPYEKMYRVVANGFGNSEHKESTKSLVRELD